MFGKGKTIVVFFSGYVKDEPRSHNITLSLKMIMGMVQGSHLPPLQRMSQSVRESA